MGKFLLVAKDREKEIKMVAKKRAVDLISGYWKVERDLVFEMNIFLIIYKPASRQIN